MRRRLVSAILLLCAASAACNRGQAGPPPAFPPTPVALEPARVMPVEDATEYVATLKSLRSTTVQPQTDGQITRILVKSGDRVVERQPLVVIEAMKMENELRAPADALVRDVNVIEGALVEAGAILMVLE